jgi:hypothetical protein
MLEAIASGKPVVTHLWIESCGQANCFIDEKNYILRDTKKEKEFGFSMPASLARAFQHPLLEVDVILCWCHQIYWLLILHFPLTHGFCRIGKSSSPQIQSLVKK